MRHGLVSRGRPLLAAMAGLTLLTGVVYPAIVTLAARILAPGKAAGSLVAVGGRVVGCECVAQRFDEVRFFWPRPSAVDYNAASSGGSNLGPANPVLWEEVARRARDLSLQSGPGSTTVPVDMVTASGSGLDPHVSLDAARAQAPRVARARHMALDRVLALVDARTETAFGWNPYVNVLLLNLDLEKVVAAD